MDDSHEFQQFLEQRYIELQTLSALARSLSAVLELDDLLTDIVDAAVRLSNAEEGLLLLPGDDGQTLRIRAVMGMDNETARNFSIKTNDTLAGQVFRSGKPVLIGDQGWQKLKTEYLVKSMLYVPLSFKGDIVGVLGVNNKRAERTFTPHDTELLQDLAAHAAIAIENARLYEESQSRTRELSTLVQAGEAANSTLAIDEVLSIFARQLIGALDVGQCYIGEYHADQHTLHMLTACHHALWQPGEGRTFAPAQIPAVAQALQQHRLVVLPNLEPQPDNPDSVWSPQRSQAQSVVYLPLMNDDQPVGLVTLYRMTTGTTNIQTLRSLQLELQQLGFDLLITLTGPNLTQKQSVLFNQLVQLLKLTEAQWVEVALWYPENHEFYTVLSYGAAIWPDGMNPGLDLDALPQMAQVIEGQQPYTDVLVDDLATMLDRVHGKSVLALPLLMKGQTAGIVLLVDTLARRTFSRRKVRLGQALVLQVANALSNARLYRDLELSLEELHHTQSKLVQTARLSAMGELAAAVAHQINNPLTTVLGDSELILRDLEPDDRDFEAVQAIHRAGKRAHEVVRRLLAMARQQQPADEQLELLDINKTILNTLTLVKSHILHVNIALSIELDEQIPLAMGLRDQLEDVWLNLLLNARDGVAGQANPQIGIQTTYDHLQDAVQVTIWDNGTGIPVEIQQRIFEPFYTTKPAGEGTGLGLHICRQIVGKCGGSIRLKSAYNQGTRFEVFLPVSTKNEKAL
ncbi:MAG: GAF domain-containing protein [Anaerolineae bacterium]|nr:GAF domain-containing protein [Anaerolineae bacterium]